MRKLILFFMIMAVFWILSTKVYSSENSTKIVSKSKLYVNTKPSDATVKILNIKPSYYDGIELDPGKYKIKVLRKGYKSRIFWISLLKGERSNFEIKLKRVNFFKNSIGQRFVYINPGSFMMGSNFGWYNEKPVIKPADRKNMFKRLSLFLPGNKYAVLNEKPVHKVSITHGFYMQTTEVTQGQWQDIMGNSPWGKRDHVKKDRMNPAVYVSWHDAKEFIKRLSLKEKKKYRLPTEAEWEYACRAGSTTEYSFGDNVESLGDYAWYRKGVWPIGKKFEHRVGTRKPNSWGLYDMHGSVWEWCEDRYDKNYYSNSSKTDPVGPPSGHSRVIRGGSFLWYPRACRSAIRYDRVPHISSQDTGFRIVCIP